jgi:hypothetical protein
MTLYRPGVTTESGRKEHIVRAIVDRLTDSDLRRTELFIDGEWTSGRGDRIEVRGPVTGDVLARVTGADEADVLHPIEAATTAAASAT